MSGTVPTDPLPPSWPLAVGEIIHIGGIPYRYAGHGRVTGATDIDFARAIRDGGSANAE